MSLLNDFINRNKTPLIIHGNFCGPSNDVITQIREGIQPVSRLDSYCKQHDLSYVKNKDLKERHKADQVLASQAFSRAKAKDSSFKERLAAIAVGTAMKAKVALGAGYRSKKRVKKSNSLKRPIQRNGSTHRKRRVRGGFIPALVPILAGLSAIGGIGTGVSQIIKNIKEAKRGDLEFEELKRHNKAMELKSGRGINSMTISTRKRRTTHAHGPKKSWKKRGSRHGKGYVMQQYKRC